MVENLQNSEHYKDKKKIWSFTMKHAPNTLVSFCVYFVSHLEHAICKLLCSLNYKSTRISSNY